MKRYSNLILSVLIFIITLVTYLITLAPAVTFTDSGELAAVVSSLGVAHPTGYPLFTILGHLWSLLPLPMDNIVKLNVFSAVAVSSSIVVLFQILRLMSLFLLSKNINETVSRSSKKLKENKATKEPSASPEINHSIVDMSSAFFALTFAFSSIVWAQAVTLEVYSLHFLMVNLTLWASLKGFISEDYKYFLTASLLLGLSFANHLTTLLIVPIAIYLFFAKKENGFDLTTTRFKQFLFLLIPLLIGLSLYFYLPLRSALTPEFNWGEVHRSFDKFLYHVSGKQYQVWMFSGADAWSENFDKFYSSLPYMLGLVFVVPYMMAVVLFLKKQFTGPWTLLTVFAPFSLPIFIFSKISRNVLFALLIMIFSGILYSFNYSIHDIEPYFYSAYLGIFLMISLALTVIFNKYKNYVYSILLALIVMLYVNFNDSDASGDYSVDEYTNILVDNLPQNSIVISSQWDYWCSAFWYKQRIENYRRDVVLLEKELVRRTWYLGQFQRWYPREGKQISQEASSFIKSLELFESGGAYDAMTLQSQFVNVFRSLIEKNIDTRPVFVTLDIVQSEPEISRGFIAVPQGFAFRLYRINQTYPATVDNLKLGKFLASLEGRKSHLHEGIRQAAAINVFNISRYAFATNQNEVSKKAFELSLKIDPNVQSYIR